MLNLPQNPKWDIARVSHSTLFNADCFDVFPFIEDKSIDAIICDLPYGTTQNKWDSVLPLDKLWEQYNRILKENGTIVLFSSQPFTSALISSNYKKYKYSWYWLKNRATGVLNAKKQPLRNIEEICIFNVKQYNPQGLIEVNQSSRNSKKDYDNYGKGTCKEYTQTHTNYPTQLLKFDSVQRTEHPTQKPIELLEYLVKTYTNEGDLVLDNTCGSGTLNLACLKLNRKSIGIEKEKQYYDVAVRRISLYCG
jgi:site-specific DNA-methyltransferase (adenine-specific)